jgi:hypothetical protein
VVEVEIDEEGEGEEARRGWEVLNLYATHV